MIILNDRTLCSGCYGCYSVCPKGAIKMKGDEEGFKYPIIDEVKCVECGLCKKVCPSAQEIQNKSSIKAYACKNKDLDTRVSSSSGGVFFLLAQHVIKENGVVFGAQFNECLEVEHGYSETLEGAIKFKGSKYVQSNMKDNYKKVKEFLDKDRLVLFSGTQCQVKALKLFLGKQYSSLILIDIVCHGVPSPLVLKKYIIKKEQVYKSDVKKIRFRDKSDGWKNFSSVIEFKNKKIYRKKFNEDIFMKGFLQNVYLRKSCYTCQAKNFNSGSDISLADYWGVQNIHKEFDDDKGTSLVLTNSEKGQNLLNIISNDIDITETDLEYAIKHNPCIVKPVELNNNRERFFKELNNSDIEKLIEKYTKITFSKKIKGKIYSLLKKENK